jgi:hypothetical protein
MMLQLRRNVRRVRFCNCWVEKMTGQWSFSDGDLFL